MAYPSHFINLKKNISQTLVGKEFLVRRFVHSWLVASIFSNLFILKRKINNNFLRHLFSARYSALKKKKGKRKKLVEKRTVASENFFIIFHLPVFFPRKTYT